MYYELVLGLQASYFRVTAYLSCQISCSQRPSAAAKTTRIPGKIPDVTSCPHSNTGTMSLAELKNVAIYLIFVYYLCGPKLINLNMV
jgi:hypothetical protein